MKKQLGVRWPGLGLPWWSTSRRRQFGLFVGISAAGHLFALLVSCFIIAMRATLAEKTVFMAAPPPTRIYEPRQLAHEVKLQQRQKSSSRPSVLPRMVSAKTSDFPMQAINLDPKLFTTTFQPKFRAVIGGGVGVGPGGGNGTDGFGPTVCVTDFIGIPVCGDKVALLVDVSVSMVEEDMGGVAGYLRVKHRINEVIDSLDEQVMFNLVVFGDASAKLFDTLVICNEANKKQAKDYLRPYNTEGNWGLATGNLQPDGKGLPAEGGTTRLDLALTAAFQQGAGTILIISDGAPMVLRNPSNDEIQAYHTRKSEWDKDHAGKIAASDEGNAGGAGTAKVWIPEVKARPPSKQPPREGESPDLGSAAIPGHWEVRTDGGHSGTPRPAPDFEQPKPRYWTLNEFLTHLRILHKNYYLDNGLKPPVIHCIGYRVDPAGHAFLQALAKEYQGQYRRVKQLER